MVAAAEAEQLLIDYQHLTWQHVVTLPPHLREDMRQELLIILWQAAIDYEPDREVKFSTYAMNKLKWGRVDVMRRWFGRSTAGTIPQQALSIERLAEDHPLAWDAVQSDIRTAVASPEEQIMEEMATVALQQELARLTGRELELAEAISSGGRQLDLVERWGVTDTRVSQIHRQMARGLRERLLSWIEA